MSVVNTREKAQADLKAVEELTAVILPEPVDRAGAARRGRRRRRRPRSSKRMAEIDMANSQSIIEFGSGGAGRAAGHQPGDAPGRAQQGCRPGRRLLARHRHHDPRLFGLRARRAPQALVVGTAARPRRAGGEVHGALRGRAGPDRQDHRQPARPRAHAAERHQVARHALREDARFLRRAGALHRRRRGQARTSSTRRPSRRRRRRSRRRPRTRA